MKNLIFFLLILLTVSTSAQDRSKFLYVDIADRSVTLYPFYKPLGGNFDPAVTLGAGLDYKQKGNLTLFQTFQATGYTTQLVGNGVTLTSSFGYRYRHSSGLFGEAALGLGASVFMMSRESFKQNEDDIYVTAHPLHVIAAIPLDLVLGYKAGKLSLYIKYRYMAVVPYTEIMPVMPVSLTGVGVRYNL